MSRRTSRVSLIAGTALLAAAVAVSGCSSVSRAVGSAKVTPDEFRVVTKAPLVIPPEYNVRPPRPGEPRPQDLIPDDLAGSGIYSDYTNSTASDAEQLLVARIGAGSSDSTVRLLIDAENGVVQKRRGFANRILFWRDGDTVDENNPSQRITEEEEARRQRQIEAATGGGEVQIGRRSKLPGL